MSLGSLGSQMGLAALLPPARGCVKAQLAECGGAVQAVSVKGAVMVVMVPSSSFSSSPSSFSGPILPSQPL